MQDFFVVDLQSQATLERWKSKRRSVNWSLKSYTPDWPSSTTSACGTTETAGARTRLSEIFSYYSVFRVPNRLDVVAMVKGYLLNQ